MTNIVLLVGNLGGDPEIRSTNGGTDVASFSLGTSRVKRDSEGKTYRYGLFHQTHPHGGAQREAAGAIPW